MSSTSNPLCFNNNNNNNPATGDDGWGFASFESLDRLLSASTSLTDATATSAEQDDGISLWNSAKLTKTSPSISRNSEEISEDHRGSSANDNKRKREAPIPGLVITSTQS
ncbi:hypothetical protein SASPL_139480 [Salvia splendens]|uniref:Uncharacterized protein n=1 Tax=Salvia splendens TaxID=180675 RepID=A0A8X8WP29_SALSN|nr:hypothetical protein SASPL_139480 [Salvia splendens]